VLERHNETTAFKAAGISLSRVALPLLLLGLATGVGLFFLDDYVTQRAERSKQKLDDVIKGRKVARSYRATDRPFVFLPDGRTLVNFLEFDPDTSTLVRPSVYVFDNRFNLRTRFMARRASYRGGRWIAEDAWSRTFMADAMPEFIRHKAPMELPLPVPPEYFGREYRRPQQMSFGELRGYIATLRAAGYRVDRLTVQLHQKLAYPLGVALLAWLALPFAFRAGRRGAVGGIALALVLGMAYFGLTAFITRIGEASLVPPVLAAWTPAVVFGLLAINRHTTLRT
jgi:lipopolysaccharide export system permease protein